MEDTQTIERLLSATRQHAVTTLRTNAIVSPAPCNVGMEQSMPRRRYQRGRIISGGKKRKVWVGIFREDRVKTDGTIRRARDRKSTRLNSSHGYISYAVFCLKKKKKNNKH